MKYIIRKKIHNTDRLHISKAKDAEISDKIRTLIDSGEVIYSEELNMYYVVCDYYTFENFAEECLELRIVIDILNEYTADVYNGIEYSNSDYDRLNVLEDSLGRLLPTKRPENKVAEE